jgi:penicillin-binding protein 1C
MTEWFVPGTTPAAVHAAPPAVEYRIVEPTPGLQLARDPRIPDDLEAFRMSIAPVPNLLEVEWHIDGKLAARTPIGELTWLLVPGRHEVFALIRAGASDEQHSTQTVRFHVR